MSKIFARILLSLAVLVFAVACGGAPNTLHARGKPTGEGPAKLLLLNHTDVAIHRAYVATTEAVQRARAGGASPGSERDIALWGDDRLTGGALSPGSTAELGVLRDGRYDVLVQDRDGREQLVKALRLKAGGTYVLEVTEGGWQFPP